MIKSFTIIILISLIIILIRKFHVERFIDNDNFWKGYRLADIFACWSNKKYENSQHEYYNSIPEKYPNSIGAEYVLRNKPMKKKNFLILNQIIDDKFSNYLTDLPTQKDIVLHLRIGDAIKGYNEKYDSFDYLKDYPIKIESLARNIQIFKNKRVVIFYGNHLHNIDLTPTKIYLQKVRDLFKIHDIKYIEKNSSNPDKDFLYMINSKTFVKSGGGYSTLIANNVKQRKNKVIQLN